MENEFGWNPTTVSAIGTAISALVVIVAAAFAGWQVLEAKQLREERSRPNVVVDFDLYSERGIINFVIENFGKTTAYNVRIAFDKPPESTLDDTELSLAESTLLKKGIPTLPPGKRIFTAFDFTLDRLQSDLPMTYEVTVTYQGPKGRKYTPLVYTLDLEFYKTLSAPGAKTIDDVAKSLDEIHKEISKWTAGVRGVHVYTRDKAAYDRSSHRWLRLKRMNKGESAWMKLRYRLTRFWVKTLDRFEL